MTDGKTYRASAKVPFPKIDAFIDQILASIATHDMEVEADGDGWRASSPFGLGWLRASESHLYLSVETKNPAALNRLKHALAGPVQFIAASENLDIIWQGDTAGLAPMDDLRILHVTAVTDLTPRMRRIEFRGENIAHFDRHDQLHCRLIFQPKGVSDPEWPMLDDRGHVVWPKGRKLDTRVYTIRDIDVARNTIVIDFALHEAAGPATRWAQAAATGDWVGIVGPAADGPKRAAFYVLAGDETGLPGIARILEWMDEKATGVAFIEIDNPAEQQVLSHPPGLELRWVCREGAAAGTTALLVNAIRSVCWPDDPEQVFFWGGCEHKAFRELHRLLRKEIGLPRDRQVLYSHWHRSLSEVQIIEIGGAAYLPE